MIRFASFVILSNLIVLIFVGGHSAISLSKEIKHSLELHSYLYFQSFEHRLGVVADGLRQFSLNRLVINSLVDPEAARTYLPALVGEYETTFGITKTFILSMDAQVIYASTKVADVPHDFLHKLENKNLSDVKINLTPDARYLIFISPIQMYKTNQGMLISLIEIEAQRAYLWRYDQDFSSSIEVFGKPIMLSGQFNTPDSGVSLIHHEWMASENFPILAALDARLKLGMPLADFLAPIITLGVQLLSISILLTVVAVMLAHKFGKTLATPIMMLCEKVGSAASTVRCSPTGTGDELEMLASAFDKARDEMEKSHHEIKIAKEIAENAVRARSEFFALMSHELRTPMHGVIGMTDVLMLSELSPEQKDAVETIRSCGDILLNVINDVLDFAKIESGKFELENISVDVSSICTNVIGILALSARRKSLRIEFIDNGVTGLMWFTDPIRLRQILLNLLNNGIKFTEVGKVTLFVSIVESDPLRSIDVLRFSVQDTGIGMNQAQQARLFKAFGQADSSTTRKFGGTGLGLAICHRLILAMGGSIQVESEVGRGSTFVFFLPLRRAVGKIMENVESKVSKVRSVVGASENSMTIAESKKILVSEMSSHFPLKILVAEDNPVNQKLIERILGKLGYKVSLVSDGIQAVQRVVEEEFDLLFMDVQMPELDGLEATRRIRRLPGEVSLVIVAMTAGALSSDRDSCLAAGMNEYISKPIEFDQLVHLLQRVHQIKNARKDKDNTSRAG